MEKPTREPSTPFAAAPTGRRELEIVVARLGEHRLGIPAAQVREILPRGPLTAVVPAHPSLAGILQLRQTVVPVISLRWHLQVADGDPYSDRVLMVVECGNHLAALVVDRIEQTYRLDPAVSDVVPAATTLAHSPVAAIIRNAGGTIHMLDLETIWEQSTMDKSHKASVPGSDHTLNIWLQPPQMSAALRAELAPTWEIEGDEAPIESNPRVWQTYQAELSDRARHLARLLARCAAQPHDRATREEIVRTLHTIKLASQVVPVSEAIRLAEHVEQLVPASTAARWPLDLLQRYANWLQELATPQIARHQVLARGRAWHSELLAT